MLGARRITGLVIAMAAAPAIAQMHPETPARERDASIAPAHAANLPAAPPVEDLVRAALAYAPDIAAARARADAARHAVAPAGALPNPMLEGMVQTADYVTHTLETEDMRMIGFELSQSFPFPGKRGARRRAAGFETAVRLHELSAAERQVALQVRRAYARLYVLDRTSMELQAAAEVVDLLAATAAARYTSGEAELEAQIKAQLEATRLAARRDDLHAERAAALAELNRMLDRGLAEEVGAVLVLPEVAPPGPGWEERALAYAPEVAARNAAVARAEAKLEVARREGRPDWSAAFGVMTRSDLDPVYTIKLGTELPIWRGVRGASVRAAAADAAAARAGAVVAARAARATAARLRAAWARAEQQLRRTRDAVLPQSSTAFDAARSAYVAGRGDFATVAEDFRLWLEARVELAEREADRFVTWAEIDALLAEPSLTTSPATPGGAR